jgi:hypothetical protein
LRATCPSITVGPACPTKNPERRPQHRRTHRTDGPFPAWKTSQGESQKQKGRRKDGFQIDTHRRRPEPGRQGLRGQEAQSQGPQGQQGPQGARRQSGLRAAREGRGQARTGETRAGQGDGPRQGPRQVRSPAALPPGDQPLPAPHPRGGTRTGHPRPGIRRQGGGLHPGDLQPETGRQDRP